MARTLLIVVLLAAVTLSVQFFMHIESLLRPLIVSVAFSVVVGAAEIMIWRKLARKGLETQSTFFTAVSGFRMLLALATLLGCYIFAGRGAMMEYCLVFLGFYVVLLIHHSMFFSQIAGSNDE